MASLIIGATAQELLTPEWLSDALDLPISGVELTKVGTGQIGDCERVTFTYSEPCDGPKSLVAKVPSQEPTSRNAGVALGTYRKESNFYMQLRDKLAIRAPWCHYVDFDDATCEFVLLLEDLAPAVQGDQITGCTPDEAALAVAELPNLHAPMWGDPKLTEMTWLLGGYGENADATGSFLGMLYQGFKARYEAASTPTSSNSPSACSPAWPRCTTSATGRKTLQHSDYRLDNMLFGTDEGGPPIAIVDWQTLAHGYGIADLSYFIGAGLTARGSAQARRGSRARCTTRA